MFTYLKRADDSLQWLALSGIVGPAIYVLVVIVLGFLHPNYDHIADYMSELGAVGAPYGAEMNVLGFGVLGVLTIAFAIGIQKGINRGGLVLGALMIALGGVALIVTGIFHCEPGCVDTTSTSELHSFASFTTVLLALAPLALAPYVRRDARWQSYQGYLWISGFSAVILALVYFGMLADVGPVSLVGAVQRLLTAVTLGWMVVMALRLLRLARDRELAIG